MNCPQCRRPVLSWRDVCPRCGADLYLKIFSENEKDTPTLVFKPTLPR